MLHSRFDAVPDWAAVRMAQADVEALQQWALNVLDTQSIEDVFGC